MSKEIYEKINGTNNEPSKSSPIMWQDMVQIIKTARMRITKNKEINTESYYLSYRDYIIIILSLTYGMKKEDIRNLNWSQINLKDGIIEIKQKKMLIHELIQSELIKYKKIYDEYYIIANPDVKHKFLFLTSIKYHNTQNKKVKQMDDPDLHYCINSIIIDSKINTDRYESISFENFAITSIGIILEQIQYFTLITDIIDKELTVSDLRRIYNKLGYNTQELANEKIKRHPVIDLIREAMILS